MSIHVYDNTTLINDNGTLGWSVPLSIAFRVKYIGKTDSVGCFFGLSQSSGAGFTFFYTTAGTNLIGFMRDATNTNSGSAQIAIGVVGTTDFQNFVLRLPNATTYSIDFDGTNYADDATNIASVDFTGTSFNDFAVGGRDATGQELEGKYFDIAVWNTGLTDDEVAAFNEGISPLAIRPGSLLSFNQGLNTTDHDLILPTGWSDQDGTAETLDASDNPHTIYPE